MGHDLQPVTLVTKEMELKLVLFILSSITQELHYKHNGDIKPHLWGQISWTLNVDGVCCTSTTSCKLVMCKQPSVNVVLSFLQSECQSKPRCSIFFLFHLTSFIPALPNVLPALFCQEKKNAMWTEDLTPGRCLHTSIFFIQSNEHKTTVPV